MTPAEIKALRESRAKLIADARVILDTADKAKVDLTAEQRASYDKMLEDADKAKTKIETEERQAKLEAELASSAGRQTDPGQPGDKGKEDRKTGAPVELRHKLRNGSERVVTVSGRRSTDEYRSAFTKLLTGGVRAIASLSEAEQRAFQADSDIEGGFLVAPQQMVAGLIKFVDDLVMVRQYANVLPPIPQAASVGAVSLDTDAEAPDWTTELAVGGEEDTLRLGKRELKPNPLAKLLKISNKLIRSSPSAEGLITSRAAYKVAVAQENGFLTGTGSNQPLGVFTASSDGVSTGRDVSTGNTTTSITVDGLLEAKYSLKGQYWQRARWMFHRDALKQISKLKDGEGRYLWQPSILAGQPDVLLNAPVDLSEFAPNTFTTGLYVGILADWSQYWIVDALSMTIQVLNELYAATNQTGYIARLETDGMPVLAEAFARVKLA